MMGPIDQSYRSLSSVVCSFVPPNSSMVGLFRKIGCKYYDILHQVNQSKYNRHSVLAGYLSKVQKKTILNSRRKPENSIIHQKYLLDTSKILNILKNSWVDVASYNCVLYCTFRLILEFSFFENFGILVPVASLLFVLTLI